MYRRWPSLPPYQCKRRRGSLCIHSFSNANIKECTLLEALKSPIFMEYHKGQPFNKNMLRPCPMLENPELLRKMVERAGAKSTDLSHRKQRSISVQSVITMQRYGRNRPMSSGVRVKRKKLQKINNLLINT